MQPASTPAAAPPPLFDQETTGANQFIRNYYSSFDSNRQSILNFLKDVSQVSFEGTTLTGGQAFLQRLNQLGLPSGSTHRVVTVDAQPSSAGQGAILIFVTGEYVGQQFSEVLQLVGTGGNYYIHNDIFRVGNTNPFNVPEAAKTVIKSFIEFYYSTYDSNRAALVSLYRPQSCYTTETIRLRGAEKILEQLQSLPGVQHDPSSITADVQQVNGNQILLVFVTGRLLLAEESNPLNFSETFLLLQEGQNYFVGNHIFKFKYG